MEKENLNDPHNPQLNIPVVSGSASNKETKVEEIDYWQHLKNQCGGKRPDGIIRGYMRTWNYEDRK